MADDDKVEEALVEESAQGKTAAGGENPPGKRKRRLGPWLFLLLVFIALPAAWMLSPPEVRDSLRQRLSDAWPHAQAPKPAGSPNGAASADGETEHVSASIRQAAPAAASEQAHEPPRPGGMPAESPAPEPAQSGMPPAPQTGEATPETKASEQLDAENRRLRQAVTQLQTERDELQQKLAGIRKQALALDLQWLARNDTPLNLQGELWRRIAAMPWLSGSDRERAGRLAAKAAEDARKLAAWRAILLRLAQRITPARQADVLPKPADRRFSWLLGDFHLYRAAGDAGRSDLRRRLLNAARALADEQWPDAVFWRQLLADVQRLDARQKGLPESLLPVRRDEEALRAQAADWLKEL